MLLAAAAAGAGMCPGHGRSSWRTGRAVRSQARLQRAHAACPSPYIPRHPAHARPVPMPPLTQPTPAAPALTLAAWSTTRLAPSAVCW